MIEKSRRVAKDSLVDNNEILLVFGWVGTDVCRKFVHSLIYLNSFIEKYVSVNLYLE